TPDRRDDFVQGRTRRSEYKIVALLLRIGEASTNEQKVAPIVFPLVQHRDQGPIEKARALGANAHRNAGPLSLIGQKGLDEGRLFSSASLRRLEGYRLITGNGQHVVEALRIQPVAQVQVGSVHRISNHPLEGDSCPASPFDHSPGQFWFGLETNGE